MKRHTIIVEGTLTARMQRVAAARAGDSGRDIATLPLLAARLAGGFSRPADRAILVPIVARALAELAFEELEAVKTCPGMARAVLASLERVWAADIRTKRTIEKLSLSSGPHDHAGGPLRSHTDPAVAAVTIARHLATLRFPIGLAAFFRSNPLIVYSDPNRRTSISAALSIRLQACAASMIASDCAG